LRKSDIGKLSLFALVWPIFIESALQITMRITDTLMLSRVSDDTVAAVGVSNQILMFAMLLFNMISLGSAVVISQYLGAKRQIEVKNIVGMSLALNFLIGLVISLMVVLFSGSLLRVFSLGEELLSTAKGYLLIAGAGLVVQSLLIVVVAMIQAHGFTRHTMFVALGMNGLNLIGNYISIFGPFGIPKLGVTGVALSTIVSQCIGLAVNYYLLRRIVGGVPLSSVFRWQRDHLMSVLRIGLPSSVNSLSYTANQFVTTAFIASLGAMILTTKIYTQNLMFLIMILCVSLARGVQIIVAHQIGSKDYELAYRTVFSNFKRSLLITLAGVAIISILRYPLMGLFTDSEEIIKLGAGLLLLGLLLEPGRNMNIIFEKSLQAVGDARFAALSSLLIMWLFSVPLTYFLGIHLGYGLYGIWAAFIVDEWARGCILFWRWRSKAWLRNKSVIQHNSDTNANTTAAPG